MNIFYTADFMKTFLNHFNIPENYAGIDFLDINLEKDTPLFIDSYYLTWSKNIYCQKALSTQKIFMEELMLSLKNGNDQKASELCNHFPEPKCTGIGLSAASFNGRGSEKIKVEKILHSLKKSKAAQTGLLEDLEELILVTEGIGADTISDITTNICMKHFAQYTLEKCKELNIPTELTKKNFYYFCEQDKEWKKTKFELPHVPLGKEQVHSAIVLLPNEILDGIISYDTQFFFTNIATPLYVKEVLKKQPTASFIYSVKSTKERKVNVTDMRNLHPEYRGGKKNMDKLIASNPKLLKDYKEVARSRYIKRKGKKS
ncbi:hypothetical protein GCM10007354_16350 [Acinetobacter courvalinii]|uniref:Uncharacterized protein n=2 Tax=Acinetobacter courvalinii TaxID=280147 RepID=A0ABD0A7F8_9GAMM|nr:hypothetical protein GCM10007354_16350 [Acinetobacter courvalinii]